MPSEATAEKEPHHQVTLIKPLFLLYTINTCLSVSFILSFATSVSSTPKCCYLLLAALCFWNLPTLTRDQEAFLFDPSFQTSGKRVNHDSPASGRKKKILFFFPLFKISGETKESNVIDGFYSLKHGVCSEREFGGCGCSNLGASACSTRASSSWP